MASAGRPSEYTEEVAEKVIQGLLEGRSVRKICAPDDMPDRGTVARWMDNNEEFAAKYARAREIGLDDQAEKLAEEMAEEEDVARARLNFDYRKWYLSKLAPRKYGDKIQQEVSGPEGKDLFTGIKVEFVRPE